MDVEVISLRQNDIEPACEVFNGIRVRRLSIKRRRGGKLGYLWQYGFFLTAALVLLALASVRRRYRLVHVHNMPDILVFSALFPRLRGARVILDLHDPMPELMTTIFGLHPASFGVRLLKRFERWSTGFAHLVLTPNTAFERLFTSRGCPASKLRVIMNSPDERIFKYQPVAAVADGLRSPAKPFIIMYHGALVERHGLDLAVEALAALRRSVLGAELHVFGQPTPFVHKVMGQARARGLEQAVHYLGPKSLEQIARAIDQCDVGIIPNRRSVFTELNLPTRIFEYLARGKPAVAPRTAGVQDYFDEESVIYFDAGNAEDLARRLHYVFSQPEEAAEITRRGQAIYRNHRWTEEREKFLDAVSVLVNGSTSPHSAKRVQAQVPAITAIEPAE
jgi:glycosyltransferase involved in cell wall biosynthesis